MKDILFRGKHKLNPTRIAKSILHRINYWLARRNLASFPQMAIFSFDHIGLRINLDGRYEKDTLELVGDYISLRIPERARKVALDIGANIGNHSLFLAQFFDEVHAFEPNPVAFSLLKFNCNLFPENKNIYINNCGLSDSAGEVIFEIPNGNIGGARIIDDESSGKGSENCKLIKIFTNKADDIADLQDKEISLIKIDVEGHELNALKGAENVIKRNRPIILFEQHRNQFRDMTSTTIEYLKSLGYDFAIIEESFHFGETAISKSVSCILQALMGSRLKIIRKQFFVARNYQMIIALPQIT